MFYGHKTQNVYNFAFYNLIITLQNSDVNCFCVLKTGKIVFNIIHAEQDRATIEKTFEELKKLVDDLSAEQQRYVREDLNSDEELTVYDLLFKDDLSKNDIKKIKEVAADLLKKVKAKISELDHWTDKQETKAAVDILITAMFTCGMVRRNAYLRSSWASVRRHIRG